MRPEARFWKKVEIHGTCWIWTAALNPEGYGAFWYQGAASKAHKVSYEWLVGPVPSGRVLDHTCRNKSCVNPGHLRPVTDLLNSQNRNGANRNSRSGYLGVSPFGDKWRAAVHYKGKQYYLGCYVTAELANDAVVEKRNELYSLNDRDRR